MTTSKRWTLLAAVFGSGIVFLDGTVVNLALPAIGRLLPITTGLGVLEAQSYVYNAYLLALASLLIPAGAMADRRGRRRIFSSGLIGFGVTSIMCGLAPTMEFLIAARVLQGAAGALLVPGSLAILTATFEGEERGRVFGLWAATSGITAVVGPLVGGLLVDTISWRAVFLINPVLVAIPLWGVSRHVAESRDPTARDVSWLGAAVSILGIGGLTFALIRGQETRWEGAVVWISLAVGILFSVAAATQVRMGWRPLIPPSLFSNRVFNVVNVATFLVYGGLYVVTYFLVIFLQGTLGYTATGAGVASIPQTLFLIFLSERAGRWAVKRGARPFLSSGAATMAVGVLWLARIPATSEPWRLMATDPATWVPSTGYLVDVLPGVTLFGLGLSLLVAPLTETLMGSVPVERAGVASAFNNAVSRVGPQLAGAVIFVAVTAVFYGSIAERIPGVDTGSPELRSQVAPLNPPDDGAPERLRAAARPASTSAFGVAMLMSAGLLAGGAVVSALGIRPGPPARAARALSLAGRDCVPVDGPA